VTLTRQFRIRDGEMEFMLESGLHIVDDVLQNELARASDDGVKNIVATIQRGSRAEELAESRRQAAEFVSLDHNSLGIVCKTQKQAEKVVAALDKDGIRARLLDPSSAAFSGGITVCTAHLAKWLEFDRVFVPEASATTYHTPMDRNLLYVACTRAMHELVLTHTAEPSAFLPC
jgi:DNA helicase IV